MHTSPALNLAIHDVTLLLATGVLYQGNTKSGLGTRSVAWETAEQLTLINGRGSGHGGYDLTETAAACTSSGLRRDTTLSPALPLSEVALPREEVPGH